MTSQPRRRRLPLTTPSPAPNVRRMDLDDYAKANPSHDRQNVIDTLPEEVRSQIMASSAPHTVVARWLKVHHNVTISARWIGEWRKENHA